MPDSATSLSAGRDVIAASLRLLEETPIRNVRSLTEHETVHCEQIEALVR